MDPIFVGTRLDRISDLPSKVIDEILSFLPFKDAVRTCTLSKKWKEKWYTVPRIIIGEEITQSKSGWWRLEGIINYILFRHEGRIRKFSIIVKVRDVHNVKSWIWRLEKKGIQELFIRYQQSNWREVPNLFSCQQLRKLSLYGCVLKPERSSRGFPSLISLELNKVSIDNDAFEKLISNCPMLEQLTIRKLPQQGNHLQINVPKLKYFWFGGEFLSMCFNTPFLEVLSINSLVRRGYYYDHDQFDLLRFTISGLPSTIKELYVQCEFQKYLDSWETFTEVVTPGCLRTLELTKFCFEKAEQVQCLLSLIGNSINLTILDITACGCKIGTVSEAVTKFWEERNKDPVMLNYLKIVRVRSFHGNDLEMKLIQYFMTNSLALEEMTVEWMEDEAEFDEDEMKGVLQLLCKTTTKLSFIVVNPDEIIDSDDDRRNYDSCSNDSHTEDSD